MCFPLLCGDIHSSDFSHKTDGRSATRELLLLWRSVGTKRRCGLRFTGVSAHRCGARARVRRQRGHLVLCKMMSHNIETEFIYRQCVTYCTNLLQQKNVTRKQRNWERRLEVKRRKRKEEKQRKKLNRLNKGDLTLINIRYITGSILCTIPCPYHKRQLSYAVKTKCIQTPCLLS